MKMFDKEYKLMAVNRVKESGKPVAEVARELDISANTLHGWVNKFSKHGNDAFPGSGNLHEADEELRKLRKENMDLKEENAILKKAAAYFAKNQK
jgi:transposase